jgi:ADP-ribose pyrophosphatase YjhB (NUDIX family)
MSSPNETIPAGFESLKPQPLPGFENSGDVYWHKFGRATIDFAALKDTREDRTRVLPGTPDREWYHALAKDPRFGEIKSFEDPTGQRLPPNRQGHPDFIKAFPGYPEIPVAGQGDELGEPFTEAADTVLLRHGPEGVEVLLIRRESGYFALPGGIRAHLKNQASHAIDAAGVYRQIQTAQEPTAETARRALRNKAGIELPGSAFQKAVYTGIVDDIRNSSGAAMYSTVFAVVDDERRLNPATHPPPAFTTRFVTLKELLNSHSEPTLGGLWGSHAYFLQRAIWSEFVVNPARFNSLSEGERAELKQVLAYDPLDQLLDDEVTCAAQNHWASAQWGRRLPWPVRGSLLSPLQGGAPVPGMEAMQGHLSLVPAWVMKKAHRLPGYGVDDLIADLDTHRDNHTDIPHQMDFRYLEVLKREEPARIAQWVQYLGSEAITANRVWVRSALAVLERLGLDKKNLGALQPGDPKLEGLLELKRQMISAERARSIAELIQTLAENDLVCDFMIRAHTAWREQTYRQTIQPGQLTADPYRQGERSMVMGTLVAEFKEGLVEEFAKLSDASAAFGKGDPVSYLSQTVTTRVAALRQELEANPVVSGAQTFYLMLQIGRVLEELAADRYLPHGFRALLHNQIGDLVYIVKMDANSAVVSGILNAARKQGARLKYKIEPEF